MDILSGVSVDWLRNLTWISAVASGILLCFWGLRRAPMAVLGSVVVFGVANIGAGIYVLSHLGDARWGGGAEERLTGPSLVEIPVVGGFLEPLEAFLGGAAEGVNGFIDLSAALPVALEFFTAAGWALFASLPLAVLVLIASYWEARRRKAEFARYKVQVEELRGELDEIKHHLGYAKLS